MARVKTWVTLGNQVPDIPSSLQSIGRSFWLQLVALLTTSGGWSVVSSSDGVTFGAGDKWLNTASKLVWGNPGAGRSHITVKSPIGIVAGLDGSYLGDQSRLWLTIHLAAATSSHVHQCAIIAHTSAPTGGSIYGVPTSANSISYPMETQLFYNVVAASHYHFGVVSAGETVEGVVKGTGAFYAMISNTGGITSFFSLLPVTSYKKYAGKDYAYGIALVLLYNSAGGAVFSSSAVSGNNIYSAIKGWTNAGVATTLSLYALLELTSTASTKGIGVGITNTGDIAGAVESSDLWLYNPNSGVNACVGSIADIYFTGATLTNYDVDAYPAVTVSYLAGGVGSGIWLPTDTLLAN